jgi:hypothetical protein
LVLSSSSSIMLLGLMSPYTTYLVLLCSPCRHPSALPRPMMTLLLEIEFDVSCLTSCIFGCLDGRPWLL